MMEESLSEVLNCTQEERIQVNPWWLSSMLLPNQTKSAVRQWSHSHCQRRANKPGLLLGVPLMLIPSNSMNQKEFSDEPHSALHPCQGLDDRSKMQTIILGHCALVEGLAPQKEGTQVKVT